MDPRRPELGLGRAGLPRSCGSPCYRTLFAAAARGIKAVFESLTVPFMPSHQLLQRLRSLDEAPWSDLDLTTRGLADRLRVFGVKPRRDTTGAARGYRSEDFLDRFSRCLGAHTLL